MPPNISHYNVDLFENQRVRVHFNNVKAENNALKQGVTVAAPSAVKQAKDHFKTTTNIYRKMCDEEVAATIKNKGLIGQIKGSNSRKYVTDSCDKAVSFQNNAQTIEQQVQAKILKVKVDKKYYKSFREACIDQHGSKGSTANITNMEGITNPSKANIGIHQNNLEEFNANIKDILVLEPNDPWVKNSFLRYIKNNKLQCGLIALSIVIEGYNIYIAMCEDGGIGKSTVIRFSGLGGSILGSKIGATLGSIFPGIGTAVGCLIGGIIGSLVLSKVTDFFCCLFSSPPTAQGEGPPPLEFIPLIYGTPDCEFQNDSSYGPPETEYCGNSFGAPDIGFGSTSAYGAPRIF